MEDETPTRVSRRTLLSGAAGFALSAILSACMADTATENAPRATPATSGAALDATQAAMPNGTVPASAPGAAGGSSPVVVTNAGTVTSAAMPTSDVPDSADFGLVSAVAAGMPTGVAIPTALRGRLSAQRLTVALPPGDGSALQTYTDLLGYMGQAFESEIVGVVGPTAAATVAAMRARVVDVAIVAPFAYVLARREASAVPLVQGEAGNGLPAVNSTVLVGLREGGPRSPAGVKHKTVAFVAADAMLGRVLPAYLLATAPRLVEDRDYTVLTVPTFADAYAAVLSRQADAGVLSTAFFRAGVAARMIDPERIRVLDKSPDVPGALVAARGDMPVSDQEAIAALFLTLNAQPTMSRLVQRTVTSPTGDQGLFGETAVRLRPATEASYDPVREIVTSLGSDLRALAR